MICCRIGPSRTSGRLCGSSYGRFDQGAMPGVTQCLCRVFDAPPLCYGVRFWGHLFGFIHPPPAPGVLSLLGLDCGIFGLFFITFYSVWRSWGDLFAKFLPPPPFFHCDKTRRGRQPLKWCICRLKWHTYHFKWSSELSSEASELSSEASVLRLW